MKLVVFIVKDQSFRYGDIENEAVKRFSTEELRDKYFEDIVKDYRSNENLTEYGPESFEDSIQKWAYQVFKDKEEIEIIETEEGEILNRMLAEARRDKIKKINGKGN